MVCPRCETANHPVDECPERHEEYHGLPSDHFDADDDGVRCWVQAIDETWHASMYFEGMRHAAACGECFETPVAGVKDDPRFVDETHTCEDCEAYLEADDDETVPDGGEFATASELRADGGLEEVFRRETITEAADGGLQVGEREVVDRVDDVCSELEALHDEVDDPDVQSALRSAIGNAWRASVLQRVDKNSDIRMVDADTGELLYYLQGTDPDEWNHKEGEVVPEDVLDRDSSAWWYVESENKRDGGEE